MDVFRQLFGTRAGMQAARGAELASLQRENAHLRAQNEARMQWLLSTVHDLRQPLQALMLFSDSLTDVPTCAEQQQRLAQMRQSAQALEQLCTELIGFGQSTQAKDGNLLGEVDLAPLLDDVRRTYQETARQRRLRLVVRPSPLRAWGDANLLARMLGSLVSTALNNTEHGGVLVGVRSESAGLRIEVHEPGATPVVPQHEAGTEQNAAALPGPRHCLDALQRLAELQGGHVSQCLRHGHGLTTRIHLIAAM